jgi:signal transduction histidine kinase
MPLNLCETASLGAHSPAKMELGHELGTPLAVIRMQAQLLLRLAKRGSCPVPGEQARFIAGLERIDDAVSKITGVIERIGVERAKDGNSSAGFS